MENKKAWIWIAILALIAVGLRGVVSNRAQIYFDGAGYIMHAWSLAQGKLSTPYWMANLDHYYPPVYPATILLFHLFIPSWADAAKIASIIFSGLLFIPVFLLARRMFRVEVGLLACALLVSYPLLVEVGSNAYSEPVFLFLVGFSMLFGWRMIDEKKTLPAFVSGVFLGIAYLARQQAVAGLVSLVAILIWFWLFQKKLSFAQFARFLALVLVGFYIFALPYDLYNYQKDKIWGLRFRMEFFKKGYQFEEDQEWFIRERTLNRDATELLTYEIARNNSPLELIRNHPKIYLSWVWEDFKLIIKRDFQGNRITPPVISLCILVLIIGLILKWDQALRNFSAHFYLLFWFLPLLFIIPLTISVLDRYLLPLCLCLVIWAGAGIESLRTRIAQNASIHFHNRIIPLAWIGFWALPLLFLHPHSLVHNLLYNKQKPVKGEAEWIKKTIKAERKIIMASEPYPALYSGNYWYMLPIENINWVSKYALRQKPDYLLADNQFYIWLNAPHDYIDQFLSPFSKPGLIYLASERFKTKEAGEKERYYKDDAIYQVDHSRSFSLNPVNIIFVSIDTLRADHLGCYGYYRNTSPNLDRLAKDGTRFEKVISQAPKTAPSHMTMLTSLYPEIHGVHKSYDDESFFSLNPTWTTLPQILKGYGYHTAAFTGGAQVTKGFGFERGFDIWEENMHRLNWKNFDPVFKWLSEVPKDEPFFLFLHTYQVHDPYVPPAPYNKIFDPDYKGWIIDDAKTLQQLAESKKYISIHTIYWGQKEFKGDEMDLSRITERDTRHFEALYDGSILYADKILGQFFEELKAKGILGDKRTLLIITADHGEEFREHNDFLHKRLYTETITVPLIFYWPGVIPAGKVNKGQVRLIDLAPTILDLINAPVPSQMQGVSLKDALLSKRKAFLSAYSEDSFIKNQTSLRTQNFLFYQKGNEQKEEFYLTSSDPKEKNNLLLMNNDLENFLKKAGTFSNEIIESFRHKLTSFHFYNQRYKDIFEIPKSEAEKVKLDQDQIEKLKALGYIK